MTSLEDLNIDDERMTALVDSFLNRAVSTFFRHSTRAGSALGEQGDISQFLPALVTAQAIIYSADVCNSRLERVADSLDDVADALEANARPAQLPEATVEIAAGDSLHDQWQKALQFKIGENDHAELSQLPDPRTFPYSFLATWRFAETDPAMSLGHVLAVAYIKLYRPWPVKPSRPQSLDPCGGWLIDIKDALGAMRTKYGVDVGESCLMSIGVVLDMALNAPDRLAVLLQRIDALDNDTLHHMAMSAVQGLQVQPHLFDGLYEGGRDGQ